MAFAVVSGRVVVVLAQIFAVCSADSFLQQREDTYITKLDVERAFLELSESSNSGMLLDIEAELRPMFISLPKNKQGTLDLVVVRYALHRFFVQKHGWYMAGLDPAGETLSTPSTTTLMKDRAPAYIQSLFEGRLHDVGLSLRDLAVFAAVLSDLVHTEVSGEMLQVYTSLRLPTIGPVPKHWAEHALRAYLVKYFTGVKVNITGMADSDFLETELVKIYPEWPSTYTWVRDFRKARELRLQPRTNPFVPQRETFDKAVTLAKEMWHSFGSFQDLECKAVKGKLIKLEQRGTGRVPLARFYEGNRHGDWTLSESVDYLRNLGALDETDPKRQSVVIANYMISRTNCLSASGFYSVCCSNECNPLLQQLERDVANYSASPSRIVELVSKMPSDTVYAPRNLSSTLLGRLDNIAHLHAGRIPIHGRLFSQWMHHAYPRECPFPHVTGTTSPMTPEDFMAHWGLDNIEVTMEEVEWYHSRLGQEATSWEDDSSLPWTEVEELVAGYYSAGTSKEPWTSSTWLRVVMANIALAAFAVPLWRSFMVAISGPSGFQKPKVKEGLV